MPNLRAVVLALLAERPRHGYALRAALEDRLDAAGVAAEVAGARVYEALASLARAGLVSSSLVPAGRRPPRRVYAPTARGRALAETWLLGGGAVPPDVAGVLLRLALASKPSAAFVGPLLAVAVARARSEREALEWRAARARRPEGWRGIVRALELDVALRRARLELELLEEVRAAVARAREGARMGEALPETRRRRR